MPERFVQLPLEAFAHEVPDPEESELKGAPLSELQDHFIHLYGRRNTIFLPDRISRINFLNVAIGDMQDAVRKEMPRHHMERMVARAVSRTFCIANGINNVSVAEGMAEKYPLTGCAYCHHIPCICNEHRADPTVTMVAENPQEEWSISDWQDHLNTLYGAKNEARGVMYSTTRLFKEVAELLNLEYSITRDQLSMDKIEQEYRLELADCVAWTISVANYYGIDIESAILKKYGRGCIKCGQNPCNCGLHNFKPARVLTEVYEATQ